MRGRVNAAAVDRRYLINRPMLPKYVTAVQIASNDQLKKSSLTLEGLAFIDSCCAQSERAAIEHCVSSLTVRDPRCPARGLRQASHSQTTFPAVRPCGLGMNLRSAIHGAGVTHARRHRIRSPPRGFHCRPEANCVENQNQHCVHAILWWLDAIA